MPIHTLAQSHLKHQHWLQEFDLFQDEVKYYQHKLARLAAQHDEQEVEERIQYFRQNFFKYLEQIDDFRHQIYAYEADLAKRLTLALRIKRQGVPEEDHQRLSKQIEDFSIAFKTTKMQCNEVIAVMQS